MAAIFPILKSFIISLLLLFSIIFGSYFIGYIELLIIYGNSTDFWFTVCFGGSILVLGFMGAILFVLGESLRENVNNGM